LDSGKIRKRSHGRREKILPLFTIKNLFIIKVVRRKFDLEGKGVKKTFSSTASVNPTEATSRN